MAKSSSGRVPRPRVDDRVFARLVGGYFAFPTVLVAHDLGLFERLGEAPRTREEICELLDVAPRPARAMLSVCASLDLVERRDDRYALTPMGEDYLLAESPTYVGGYFRIMVSTYEMGSYENVREAVLSDRPQAYEDPGAMEEWSKTLEEQSEWAAAFTRSMHSISMAPASAWPAAFDLSEHRTFLDVGGGSGAHAIAAVSEWPELEAVVFDLPFVCEVTREFVGRAELEGRIRTHAGDMWKVPFPEADVHFYSQVLHDHPPDRCRWLIRKSFEALPSGGRILIHELLLDDDEGGPLPVATVGVAMLLLTQGQQFTAPQLRGMLEEAGFREVETLPTFGDWSLMSARKP